MKKPSARRPRGWWDTPEIREDFFTLPSKILEEKYSVSPSYVWHLKRRMQECPPGTFATPEARTEAEKIGEEILALRLAAGLDQAEFGRLVHSHRNRVIEWEAGRTVCPPEKLELLRLKLQKQEPKEITITSHFKKESRSVTLVEGGIYQIEPINPKFTRQRGRMVKIIALPYGSSKNPYEKAVVEYLDNGKMGKVKSIDLVQPPKNI